MNWDKFFNKFCDVIYDYTNSSDMKCYEYSIKGNAVHINICHNDLFRTEHNVYYIQHLIEYNPTIHHIYLSNILCNESYLCCNDETFNEIKLKIIQDKKFYC